MNTFDTVNNSRRSIRSFATTPVPASLIDDILNDALKSPSSSNTQPFKVIVATGEVCQNIAQQLSRKFQQSLIMKKQPAPLKLYSAYKHNMFINKKYPSILGKYPQPFQERRINTGVGLYKLLGIERHDYQARDDFMAKNFKFFDAPAAIWIFVDPGMTFTALVDAGIFMQTLMLSATSKGLGTCAQGSLGIWREPLDQYFDIPEKYQLLCGLSLGYPTDDPVNSYIPPKIDLEELLIKVKC